MSIVSLYQQFQQQEPISSVIKHYNVLYTIYSFEGFRKAFLLLFKANPRMKFRGIYSTFFYLDAFDHSPDRSEILHDRFFYMHFLLPFLSHTKKTPTPTKRNLTVQNRSLYWQRTFLECKHPIWQISKSQLLALYHQWVFSLIPLAGFWFCNDPPNSKMYKIVQFSYDRTIMNIYLTLI